MMNRDAVLSPTEAKPFLGQIDRLECRWCETSLEGQPIKAYPHDGGWTVEGFKEPQWLYIVCPKCGYQWALWKLGVKRERI